MAKKPRSQRRRKGNENDANGDNSNIKNNDLVNNKDALSDSHTVDDNMSVMSFAEEFEGAFVQPILFGAKVFGTKVFVREETWKDENRRGYLLS